MSPVEQAAEVYRREPCARSFREDLEAHLLNGYVFNTPELFVMGRPIIRAAKLEEIINPWHAFPAEECDCWMVYLLAGRLSALFSHVPYHLKYVAWEKRNRLRFYEFRQVEHLGTVKTSLT